MRDVSRKPNTLRIAGATATLHCLPETVLAVKSGNVPKSDPVGVAKIAGIQAAKNTSLLIPYCHQVPLDFVEVNIEPKESAFEIVTLVKAVWKTGVEMEALAAANAAALTLYDMLKPIDDTMKIDDVSLLAKKGGKSDFKESGDSLRAGVLVVSDSGSAGARTDISGRTIKQRLEDLGLAVMEYKIIPDDAATIEAELLKLCDDVMVDVVFTTGGTGIGPRDVTPEVTSKVLAKKMPGVSEVLRAYGQERTRFSMLSRGVAGVRGHTVVINLPGSPSGVEDSLDVLLPWIFHSAKMIQGGGH